MHKQSHGLLRIVSLSLSIGMAAAPASAQDHFDAKGKAPSEHTIQRIKALRGSLPFENDRDFEEAKRGFIAAPSYKQIMADAGHVAWDIGSYEWLLGGDDFDSIHPSLQRQAVLNMAYGLYEVLPEKIYQVRGASRRVLRRSPPVPT